MKKDKLINKRINVIRNIILISFITIFLYIGYLTIYKKDYYTKKLEQATDNVYSYKNSPRGKIYDRNYNVIVDNEMIPIISYIKPKKISYMDEIKESKILAEIIDLDYSKLTIRMLKEYYYNQNDLDYLITEEEWNKNKRRELSNSDIYNLKIERIDSSMFNEYTDTDKKGAYIFYLMNNGYSYEEKIIKKDNVTDKEIAVINSNLEKLNGFSIKYDFNRKYNYDDTLKSILGNISNIPEEEKEMYLSKGYSLTDLVGSSYLEKQYESFLKGEKGTYTIIDDEIKELTPSKRGNDIVLTIDIKLQQEVDKILEEELIRTKYEPLTDAFNSIFVVIQDPNNGEILAMSGKSIRKVNNTYEVYDNTIGVITNSVTPGSVVKGASMLVGYNTGAIKIGEYQSDNCIKIYSKPQKCSSTRLGTINDLTALAKSSNVYQFRTAFKVANFNYSYNAKLTDVVDAFNTYRKTFNELGLGVKTNIDLPVDGIGEVGTKTDADLYLNYVIGQYDTYTTLQLSEYVSTIANSGTRYSPHLLKEVHKSDNGNNLGTLTYTYNTNELNKVNTLPEYIERVRLGFREVMTTGLGIGFMGDVTNPCGKTGTSESFYDSNGDGKVDTETLSNAFVGFYPYENPKMSIAITFPNLVNQNTNSTYRSYANKRVTRLISNKFFELYG